MHRAKLPADFSAKVRAGLSMPAHSMPIARDGAALSVADVRRIVLAAQRVDERDGWEGDLVRPVATMAATGGRFGQVMRMHVADVQAGRLMLPTSRKGRSAAGKAARIAVPVGEDVLALIRPAVAGRPLGAPLFERWWHEMRNGVRHRARRGPWTLAAELQRPWAKILAEAGLPKSVVPYALRHSSICRMLRQGLPVRLVAAVHDTSSEMLEKHYSGAITSLLDDLLAGAVVPLLPGNEAVVPLRARKTR
jgi:integrase